MAGCNTAGCRKGRDSQLEDGCIIQTPLARSSSAGQGCSAPDNNYDDDDAESCIVIGFKYCGLVGNSTKNKHIVVGTE